MRTYHYHAWTIEQWAESTGVRLELFNEVARRLVNHNMADRCLAVTDEGKFYLTTDNYGTPRFQLPKVDCDIQDCFLFEETARAIESARRCF